MPLEMFNFTQPEYNSASRLIEETSLIPHWLPKNWMSHIDRYAKGFHVNQQRNQGAQAASSSGRSSSFSVTQQAKSKSLSSPTKSKRRSGLKTVNTNRTAAGIAN